MAQHHFDPVNWTCANDHTSPVQVQAFAPMRLANFAIRVRLPGQGAGRMDGADPTAIAPLPARERSPATAEAP